MLQELGKYMATELTSLTPSTTQIWVVFSQCEKFGVDRKDLSCLP